MYLDTDISLSRDERVRILAASPYSLEELEQILVDEVHPVCFWNLCIVAGEWAGFDPEWLRSIILSRSQRRFRLPCWLRLARFALRLPGEWSHTQQEIVQQRALLNAS